MSEASPKNILLNTQFLPNERWEFTLDSLLGILTFYGISVSHTVILTSLRVISNTRIGERQTTTHMNIEEVASVDIIEFSRSTSRLLQGLTTIGLAVIIGLTLWVVLGILLLVIIGAGIPFIIGVYLLTGYLLPSDQSELLIHSQANSIRFPLLSPSARRDSHSFTHRLYELSLMGRRR